MNIFELTISQITNYLLIFARISSFLAVAPLFGSRNIPLSSKMGLALLISFILLPIVLANIVHPPNFITFISLVAKEVFVGLILGFASILIFAIVQFAGHLIDMHMGFAIMNVIDPQAQTQVTVIGQFMYFLLFLLFLIVNGHHLILKALFESFDIVPLSSAIYKTALTQHFVIMTGKIFITGLKIALPAIGLIFLAELSMGIIARTVPQINIFLVGFPLRIALGLFMVGASIPLFLYVGKPLISQMYKDLIIAAKLLSGG